MKILNTLFLSLLVSISFAQNPNYKVTYNCTTKLFNGKSHDGLNTLYFNEQEGLYVHNDWPQKNEVHTERAKGGGGGGMVYLLEADDEGMPVYTNLEKQYLYFKTNYFSNRAGTFFILKDSLPNIRWSIQPDSKKIENFTCQKAIGVFGGRTYEVWFTMDIPVRLGPYKLHGLPGLILEAASTDGRVKYEFTGYEKLEASEVILQKPQKGTEITWEDLKTFLINDLKKVEAKYDNITHNDPVENWNIEKWQFTIIGDYKRARRFKKGKYGKGY